MEQGTPSELDPSITNVSTRISSGFTALCRTGTRNDGCPKLSCILEESGTQGYTAEEMHDKMMWRASNTSELYCNDCPVPKENLLGPRGNGFHQMMELLDGGRLSIGSMGLGKAQGCYDLAKKQVNTYKSLSPEVRGRPMEALIVELEENPEGQMSIHEGEA